MVEFYPAEGTRPDVTLIRSEEAAPMDALCRMVTGYSIDDFIFEMNADPERFKSVFRYTKIDETAERKEYVG